MAIHSPTPVGSSHFALPKSKRTNVRPQAVRRPAYQFQHVDDVSSDDSEPVRPMKLSALTEALLNANADAINGSSDQYVAHELLNDHYNNTPHDFRYNDGYESKQNFVQNMYNEEPVVLGRSASGSSGARRRLFAGRSPDNLESNIARDNNSPYAPQNTAGSGGSGSSARRVITLKSRDSYNHYNGPSPEQKQDVTRAEDEQRAAAGAERVRRLLDARGVEEASHMNLETPAPMPRRLRAGSSPNNLKLGSSVGSSDRLAGRTGVRFFEGGEDHVAPRTSRPSSNSNNQKFGIPSAASSSGLAARASIVSYENGQDNGEAAYSVMAANTQQATGHGSAQKTGVIAAAKIRNAEDIGLQSSMRVKRAGRAGGMLSGPARRGRRHQVEREPSPVQDDAGQIDNDIEQMRQSQEPESQRPGSRNSHQSKAAGRLSLEHGEQLEAFQHESKEFHDKNGFLPKLSLEKRQGDSMGPVNGYASRRQSSIDAVLKQKPEGSRLNSSSGQDSKSSERAREYDQHMEDLKQEMQAFKEKYGFTPDPEGRQNKEVASLMESVPRRRARRTPQPERVAEKKLPSRMTSAQDHPAEPKIAVRQDHDARAPESGALPQPVPKQELAPRPEPNARPALGPRDDNVPHRAPPPPPKMSVIDIATASGGASVINEASKKRNNIRINGRVYTRMERIGKGGSGVVHRVMAENHKSFAWKKVDLRQCNEAAIRACKGEIDLLRKLRTEERVVRLIDYEHNREKQVLHVLMEMGELDFYKLLHARQNDEAEAGAHFDPSFVRFYWKELLECIQAVHRRDIVHLDLKPANLLIAQGKLKLIDFGIAGAIETDETCNVHRQHQIGTPNYMSPESLEYAQTEGDDQHYKVGKPSDIWSLGCMLYQMVYGTTPFNHIKSTMHKWHAILDPNVEISYPETGFGDRVKVPRSLIKTMKKCLHRNPSARPTVEQLLDETDPFLYPGDCQENHLPAGHLPIDEAFMSKLVAAVYEKIRTEDQASDTIITQEWPKQFMNALRIRKAAEGLIKG